MSKDVNIFVVDDDSFYSALIQERIALEEGYSVSLFENATDLLTNITETTDIAIIDYELPDMNGLEILRNLQERFTKLSCIFLSGQLNVNVVVEAYKNGATRYIIKNENALVELVKAINEIRNNLQLKSEIENLKDEY